MERDYAFAFDSREVSMMRHCLPIVLGSLMGAAAAISCASATEDTSLDGGFAEDSGSPQVLGDTGAGSPDVRGITLDSGHADTAAPPPPGTDSGPPPTTDSGPPPPPPADAGGFDTGTPDTGSIFEPDGSVPTTCPEAYGSVGCCSGNTLYYCKTTTLTTKSCTGTDVCGWESSKGYYNCVASPGGADPSGTNPIACK